MVRLKGAGTAEKIQTASQISIPYGSIKRGQEEILSQADINFNSLWFD